MSGYVGILTQHGGTQGSPMYPLLSEHARRAVWLRRAKPGSAGRGKA